MMRTSTAVQVGLVLLLPVACFALIGSRNRITVRKYRTNYRIDSWDDDREDPYRVTFWKFGLKSVYTFDTSGNIKTLTARDTLYTFDEEVGPVIRTRMLQVPEDDVMEVDVDPVDEIACSDCHQTWNTVCAEGLDDVCYLDDNPLEEFDEDAIDSTRRFCSGFGAACEYTADEACGGQCTQGTVVGLFKFLAGFFVGIMFGVLGRVLGERGTLSIETHVQQLQKCFFDHL